MGLGLCFSCVKEYWEQQQRRTSAEGTDEQGPRLRPRYAITMAPSSRPILGPGGEFGGMMLLAMPTCYHHLTWQAAGNGAAPDARQQQGPATPQQQQRPAPAQQARPTGRRWDRADLLP